jgi:lysozyme
MKTSKSAVSLIKSFEKLSLTAYVCPAGVMTIGYGHTGPHAKQGKKISEATAEKLLKEDLVYAEIVVNTLVKVPLNQNQFDALVSFAYNVGQGSFGYSTLLKRLNSKEDSVFVAKQELPRWVRGADNEVLQGLVRRRAAEVELFCSPLPVHITETSMATELVTITSKINTTLKKEPVASQNLTNDKKVKVNPRRTYKNNRILGRNNGHTQIEMDFNLGTWWVFDAHWEGLTTKVEVSSYEEVDGFRRLRNFPYFYQRDNGPEGWRQCQSSSIAMVLKYLDVKGINDDVDYLRYVNKYGDTTERVPHFMALKELGVEAKFKQNLNAQDVKDQINKGLPVAAGILHKGPSTSPAGGGHFIVITGYSSTHWLVQDPYGELDLVNGTWEQVSPTAGRNQKYSFKNMDPRFFVGGKSNGWGWVDFKYLG